MKLSPSLLARQTPATLAALAKAHARGTLVTHEIRREGDALVIVLTGLKMPSLANLGPRQQITAKDAQSKALAPILATLARPLPFPWDVTIERTAPKLLDQATNIDASAKRIVDLIARWCAVDDATDETVRYAVTQRQGPCAVTITIGPRRPV